VASAWTGRLPPSPPVVRRRPALRHHLLGRLGPGLITGAADDDPSGIVTYSQAGAQFGFALGWTMLATLPIMAAVQEISARLGRVTGSGLAAILRSVAPGWLVALLVGLLVVANVINLGADIGAMAETIVLLLGGRASLWAIAIALFCSGAEIWLAYKRYVQLLKWLTVSLLAYVALLLVVHLPLRAVLAGVLVPHIPAGSGAAGVVLALLGTTISPYLFFWQAAEEVEDMATHPGTRPLRDDPDAAGPELSRIGFDTWAGMGYSNGVALAIIIGTGATLHAGGITNIQTAAQAASALQPVAGRFAAALFAAGIFGTGLLAVPVLAGSSAYAIGDALHWRVGLGRRALEARAFYAALATATLLGLVIALSPIDPMKALVWSAMINGAVSAPLIAAMVVLGSMRRVMGALVLPAWLRALGWLAAAAMAASTAGLFLAPA